MAPNHPLPSNWIRSHVDPRLHQNEQLMLLLASYLDDVIVDINQNHHSVIIETTSNAAPLSYVALTQCLLQTPSDNHSEI